MWNNAECSRWFSWRSSSKLVCVWKSKNVMVLKWHKIFPKGVFYYQLSTQFAGTYMGTIDVYHIRYRRPHDWSCSTAVTGNGQCEVARHDHGSGKYRKWNFRNERHHENHISSAHSEFLFDILSQLKVSNSSFFFSIINQHLADNVNA